jgi:hypothetical protein
MLSTFLVSLITSYVAIVVGKSCQVTVASSPVSKLLEMMVAY